MRFAADENFDGYILRGLLARLPDLDIVRVQDTEMYQSSDPDLLEWLAKEGRILLTHDVRTMRDFAYERVGSGLLVVGVIIVLADTSIGQAIDDLALMIGAGQPKDFENQVSYVPL